MDILEIYTGWWFGTFGLFFHIYWECHIKNPIARGFGYTRAHFTNFAKIKMLRKIFWISKITKLVKLLAFET